MSIDTEQEVRPVVTEDRDPTDRDELRAYSAIRWRNHQKRVLEDPLWHPELKKLFLNQTLCGTRDTAKELGVGIQRVTHLRLSSRKPGRPRPHPIRLDQPDDIISVVADTPDYAYYKGLLAYFKILTRRGKFNIRTLVIDKTTPNLHGRPPGAKNKPKPTAKRPTRTKNK